MSELCVLTHLPERLLRRVPDAVPGTTVVEVPAEGALAADLRGDVLVTQAWGSPNLADVVARGVRWVHAYGTGVNAFPFDALGDRPLTCSRGASAIPISEWVLAVMLAAEKQLPQSWIHTPEDWRTPRLGALHEKTLGLIGLGGIGTAVAVRALAFGMRVLALRRSPTPSPLAGVETVKHLDDLLPEADHLVVAAPATPETRRMLGAEAFARVKPGVHLVNIARGALVDQDALRDALDAETVGLASLDVCHPEPPPEGHWLYTHPRVRLSAHISWSAPHALEWLLDPFLENLRRFASSQPLEDLVDRDLGY